MTEANWDLFYTFEQPVLPLLKLFKCKTVAFGRIHDIRKQLIKKPSEVLVPESHSTPGPKGVC